MIDFHIPGLDKGNLMAQTVKRLSTMRETWVQWKIPWTEEPDRLHVVHGVAKSRARLSDFTSKDRK